MKTIDDICEKIRKNSQITIDTLKRDPKKYEVGADIREHLKTKYSAIVNDDFNNYVSANLGEVTATEFHDIVDEIEDNFLIDYDFDINLSSVINGTHYYYWNHKAENTSINVDFHPKSCKAVPTGRLVPEIKQVCSW